jgi:SAM-dependent methyltransferase
MTGTSRWADAVGDSDPTRGRDYAARFQSLADQGADVHGEASLCASLIPPGARILDAGCGTGRVAIRLAELGYDCVGVDNDESMLDVARTSDSGIRWLLRDLAALGDLGGAFDLIVAAGNVIPLLAGGAEAAVITVLAERLAPGGLLVAGFGLDAAHLPLPEAPFGLHEYDAWCEHAGLELIDRFGTWSGAPYDEAGGYAVSISRRLS